MSRGGILWILLIDHGKVVHQTLPVDKRFINRRIVKAKKSRSMSGFFVGDPDGIRTHDRLLRRQMLDPAELPDPVVGCF